MRNFDQKKTENTHTHTHTHTYTHTHTHTHTQIIIVRRFQCSGTKNLAVMGLMPTECKRKTNKTKTAEAQA
jgi:hypothetical protein